MEIGAMGSFYDGGQGGKHRKGKGNPCREHGGEYYCGHEQGYKGPGKYGKSNGKGGKAYGKSHGKSCGEGPKYGKSKSNDDGKGGKSFGGGKPA